MSEHTLKQEDLAYFYGSQQWFRHWIVKSVIWTEGAQHVWESGGAYWLCDEIAFRQMDKKAIKQEPFQVWDLKVKNSSGVLTCEDGDGKVIYRKRLDYTDFPLPHIRFFVESDGQNRTIMLPTER